MSAEENTDTRAIWDRLADDWLIQVGDEGDLNRQLNSDPVLWRMAGDVEGRDVLDAGCGVGYLSRKLADAGARVVGVDFSERMLAIARDRHPGIDFRLDSCCELATIGDESCDLIVSNYVLMDLEDLDAAVQEFFRALKPGGVAVLVFSHPCFPSGWVSSGEDGSVSYRWERSYFVHRQSIEPPWDHFRSEFVWYHRPLTDYWKAFREAGFIVEDFEEPRIEEARYELAPNGRELEAAKSRPLSVAFKLRRGR